MVAEKVVAMEEVEMAVGTAEVETEVVMVVAEKVVVMATTDSSLVEAHLQVRAIVCILSLVVADRLATARACH